VVVMMSSRVAPMRLTEGLELDISASRFGSNFSGAWEDSHVKSLLRCTFRLRKYVIIQYSRSGDFQSFS
jgi:hypothetical protein